MVCFHRPLFAPPMVCSGQAHIQLNLLDDACVFQRKLMDKLRFARDVLAWSKGARKKLKAKVRQIFTAASLAEQHVQVLQEQVATLQEKVARLQEKLKCAEQIAAHHKAEEAHFHREEASLPPGMPLPHPRSRPRRR